MEGYEKYGQRKNMIYPLIGLIFGIVVLISSIIIIEIPLIELEFFSYYFYIFITVVFGVAQFLLFLNCYRLTKTLYEKITMFPELMTILISYFISSALFNVGNYMKSYNHLTGYDIIENIDIILVIILVARNLLWVFISIFHPIVKSKKFFLIEYSENPECSKSLERVLCSEIGALYFSKYMCFYHNPDGCDIFNLFTLLISWKEKKVYKKDTTIIDNKIKHEYENNEYLKNKIGDDPNNQKITKCLMKMMKGYFDKFKESEAFLDLNTALKNRDLINQRLRYANLI